MYNLPNGNIVQFHLIDGDYVLVETLPTGERRHYIETAENVAYERQDWGVPFLEAVRASPCISASNPELMGDSTTSRLFQSNWAETKRYLVEAHRRAMVQNFETTACEPCGGTGWSEDGLGCPPCNGGGIIYDSEASA